MGGTILSPVAGRVTSIVTTCHSSSPEWMSVYADPGCRHRPTFVLSIIFHKDMVNICQYMVNMVHLSTCVFVFPHLWHLCAPIPEALTHIALVFFEAFQRLRSAFGVKAVTVDHDGSRRFMPPECRRNSHSKHLNIRVISSAMLGSGVGYIM